MTQIEQIEKFIKLMDNPLFLTGFILLTIWTFIWKGIALWKASNSGNKQWFIALLIVNTVGILEIIYIFYFSKNKNTQQ